MKGTLEIHYSFIKFTWQRLDVGIDFGLCRLQIENLFLDILVLPKTGSLTSLSYVSYMLSAQVGI
jgi:hypothetical protein